MLLYKKLKKERKTMRFKVFLKICGESMSIDYRRKILHLLKTGMSKYSKETFEDYFSKAKLKQYTWTIFFKDVKFTKEKIYFNKKETEAIVDFSFSSYEDGINLYNSLVNIKNLGVNFSENAKAKITSIKLIPDKLITSQEVVFKTLSPIICREHNPETFENKYFSFEDNEFEEILKRNLFFKLKDVVENSELENDINEISFQKTNLKKLVIKHYDKSSPQNSEVFKGQFIDATVGTFKMKAKSYILKYVYDAGLGSITGNGFGMLEIINQN